MNKRVAIFGAGVAGLQLAKQLKHKADVTIVSPLNYFEVPMGMPRLLVEPGFTDRSIVPVSAISENVTFVSGKLTAFNHNGATVENTDGSVANIRSDVTVLATGSSYANSVTRAQSGTQLDRLVQISSHHASIKSATNIVIVGGGPIGIELAGEISEDFPDKKVTVIEGSSKLLNGTTRKVAEHAENALRERGVEFVMAERVTTPPHGEEPEHGGIAQTDNGTAIPFDMLFWAVGSQPNTSYMEQSHLNERGQIKVDEHLAVKGYNGVYAMGDITDVREVKKAMYIANQVPVVAKNILAELEGKSPVATYKAKTGDDTMIVTLGRSGGVAHMPVLGTVTANWMIRMFKSRDMLSGMFRKSIGAPK